MSFNILYKDNKEILRDKNVSELYRHILFNQGFSIDYALKLCGYKIKKNNKG